MGVNSSTVIIFDLDDTLYKERHYTRSCFHHFSQELKDRCSVDVPVELICAKAEQGDRSPLQSVCVDFGVSEARFATLLASMRAHMPDITLPGDSALIVEELRARKMPFGIITDGRSVTQRAKIAALGLEDASIVLISEEQGVAKPDVMAFTPVMDMFRGYELVYVADNPRKDFVAPNRLGWETVMLIDDGLNVHNQDVPVGAGFEAQSCVKKLSDLVALIDPHCHR